MKNKMEKRKIELETDGNIIYWISKGDIINSLDIYPDKIIHNGRELPMMSSASACVAMLKEYLNKIEIRTE